MNPEDSFEESLRRQPLRTPPAAWRREILVRAETHAGCGGQPKAQPEAVPWAWLRELLWPAPRAWAGLAATWLGILGLNLGTQEPAASGPEIRPALARACPQELLRKQHQLFAELVEPPEKRDAKRPRHLSLPPRSELPGERVNV